MILGEAGVGKTNLQNLLNEKIYTNIEIITKLGLLKVILTNMVNMDYRPSTCSLCIITMCMSINESVMEVYIHLNLALAD